MILIKSLLPEITFLTGTVAAIIGLWSFTNWQITLIFAGGVLILASAYINEIMSLEVED